MNYKYFLPVITVIGILLSISSFNLFSSWGAPHHNVGTEEAKAALDEAIATTESEGADLPAIEDVQPTIEEAIATTESEEADLPAMEDVQPTIEEAIATTESEEADLPTMEEVQPTTYDDDEPTLPTEPSS